MQMEHKTEEEYMKQEQIAEARQAVARLTDLVSNHMGGQNEVYQLANTLNWFINQVIVFINL